MTRRISARRDGQRLIRTAFGVLAIWTLSAPPASAKSVTSAPPLPAPAGTVVNVSTDAQLQAAVSHLTSNTTIVVAPGTYVLSSTLYLNGSFTNVGIRGASNNSDDVVLVGPGMTRVSYGNVPYGIWTGGGVNGILIANLTIRDIYYHPIIFNAGTQNPRVYNVHLLDAGQQFIKSNPDSAGNGVNGGIVEYSVIEYTSTAPTDYTNGVDVHAGVGWVIRHNLFRNIVSAPGLAGPALLVWNHSRDTIAEGNSFVNCARGISFGLQDASGTDHSGGVIRNNFFFRASGQSGDVAIGVFDSPNTQVLNNTIFVSGTYSSPIEYRFAQTTGLVIANNLLDGIISARDGATATVTSNLTGATAGMFVNAAAGDLHLAATATSAIDRGATAAVVADDWDGELRPQGAAYDIGADERGATTAAYQIAGHVIDGSTGTPLVGVAVALSGARSQSTTTGASGEFSFAGLAGSVDYTVTPTKANVSFTPGSEFYSALRANEMATDFRGFSSVANKPPTVSVAASGATFTAPATITVTATAADPDGTVTKVDFYAGTTLIGTDAGSPYSVSWANVPAGTYALTAVATDNGGLTTRSAAVTVTVNAAPASTPTPAPAAPVPAPAPNLAPKIALTSPSSGATFTAGTTITLRATTSDSDGRIRQVRFYAGSTLIGSDSYGPTYSVSWRDVSAGQYSLTAVATDDDGATTRSAAVIVTVKRR